jgi:hypothetical protein
VATRSGPSSFAAYASADAEETFIGDFVAAWGKVTTRQSGAADRAGADIRERGRVPAGGGSGPVQPDQVIVASGAAERVAALAEAGVHTAGG